MLAANEPHLAESRPSLFQLVLAQAKPQSERAMSIFMISLAPP
jgi:hypothetical protein